MDNNQLKKKLNTHLSDAGRLQNVTDELLYELLISWEEWPGTAKDFYKSIGFSHRQIASLLGKAKKLKREGSFGSSDFKEIQIESSPVSAEVSSDCGFIELACKDGKLIRFPQVSQLLEYMKKAG